MNHISTIIQKQCRDTWKNKTVLIQFVMFPLLGIIMTKTVKIEGMPENFFVNLFATMYVGMAPLTSVCAIISEEKEKNTLRVLLMANVTPAQYLVGVGCYVFLACLIGVGVFDVLLCEVTGKERVLFFGIMMVGILVSIMLGAAIGVGSKNQMTATSIAVPVMMAFAFLPMISMFNEGIASVAGIIYSEQVRILANQLLREGGTGKAWAVIAGNFMVFGGLFAVLYRKRGLM